MLCCCDTQMTWLCSKYVCEREGLCVCILVSCIPSEWVHLHFDGIYVCMPFHFFVVVVVLSYGKNNKKYPTTGTCCCHEYVFERKTIHSRYTAAKTSAVGAVAAVTQTNQKPLTLMRHCVCKSYCL